MIVLAFAAALVGAVVQEAEVFGIGTSSCAKATQPQSLVESGTWIMGFWSGLNAYENSGVGKSTDAPGIIGEVKLYCSNHPSDSLALATFETYKLLRRRGR